MGLTAEDRLDIEELLVRYEYAACVEGDEQTFLDLFTDDAELDGPRGFYEGAEGVKAFARQVLAGTMPRARVRLSNFLVVDDGDDRATMIAAFVRFSTDPDGGDAGVQTGTYECVARKVEGGWKLQRRIIRIDGLPQFRDTPAHEAGARYVRDGDEFRLEPAAPADPSAEGA